MSRPLLSLYELERPALKALSAELKEALLANDAEALADVLELGSAMREQLAEEPRLVDVFLRADSGSNKPLWACLRRVSKKRALTKVLTSSSPALEGRLRAFDVVRDDKQLAEHIDKLLNTKRLPWFMRRDGASCGWVNDAQRTLIADKLQRLKPALTAELTEFADAINEAEGDAILHDGL